MKAITCPQCGGLIQEINESRSITECEYCGAKILVPFEKKAAASEPKAADSAADARPGFNDFGYPIDEELPFTAGVAAEESWRSRLTTGISALLVIASAVAIFVAVSAKARSRSNQAQQQQTKYRTPTPLPTPNRGSGVDKNIQSRAVSLPQPVLPKGTVVINRIGVEVFVRVDAKGNVTEAQGYTGTEVLKQAAELAAKQAKFKPDAAGKESAGILFYEFSPN